MMTEPKGFTTTAAAALSIGVTPRTLERWCADGKVPGAEQHRHGSPQGFRWLVPSAWARRHKGKGAGAVEDRRRR